MSIAAKEAERFAEMRATLEGDCRVRVGLYKMGSYLEIWHEGGEPPYWDVDQ